MKPLTDIPLGKLLQPIYALPSNFINTYSLSKSYNSSIKVLRIRIMPTEVHDCCQDWWRVSEITLRDVGDLTGYEQAQIDVRVGTSKLPYASLT